MELKLVKSTHKNELNNELSSRITVKLINATLQLIIKTSILNLKKAFIETTRNAFSIIYSLQI